jgi:hypothetical protein
MHNPDDLVRISVSRIAGQRLAHEFNQGVEPGAVDVPIVLHPGEFCVGHAPVTVLCFMEAEAEYVKTGGGYELGRNPFILPFQLLFNLIQFLIHVIGNRIRRSRAEREAAPQWRPIDVGTLFLTNRRFAVHGQMRWHDLWFEDIRMSDCNGIFIRLDMSGSPPLAPELTTPDWWYVMFNKVAYDRVVMPPPPPPPQAIR